MGWVLLWVIISANGAMTSGSLNVPTGKACQQARNTLEEANERAARAARQSQPHVGTKCLDLATGERN
ncbi:hypothetical protein LRS73_35655 (plasmid) [Methylobacterium currus]|uniref:hypothetical protein n=1 Tax=Methylobacterium currus TaxID=2051553 RepID=UPI001E59892F|nr:hypothetical protein [Methylobacterium currus]UHC20466.1 hypothetical protein LRS73_35655 [Methylobacterium currus]